MNSEPWQQTNATQLSDTIANIARLEPAIADVPCDDILGVVVYDLPGRDCAAKASNGELAVGELARYKSEFIDRAFSPVYPDASKNRRYVVSNNDV